MNISRKWFGRVKSRNNDQKVSEIRIEENRGKGNVREVSSVTMLLPN